MSIWPRRGYVGEGSGADGTGDRGSVQPHQFLNRLYAAAAGVSSLLIGKRFDGLGFVAFRRQARAFGPFDQGSKLSVARGQRHLLAQQLLDLFFHHLLVEELPAGDAIDLRPQRRDSIFVFVLHTCLAGDRPADEIVAQDQIGCGGEIADAADAGKGYGHCRHPRANRHVANLVATRQYQNVIFLTFSEGTICRTSRHPFSPAMCALPRITCGSLHFVRVNN